MLYEEATKKQTAGAGAAGAAGAQAAGASTPVPVYLGRAAELRPDLSNPPGGEAER